MQKTRLNSMRDTGLFSVSLTALTMLAASTGIHAQETVPSTENEIVEIESTTLTGTSSEPVRLSGTISSSTFGQPLIETPYSIATYDLDLIEEQRAFTLADVLRWDPSVAPAGSGSETFYGRQDYLIRGFKADTFSNFYIDGMQYIHMVEPAIDDKESVEVLKGPAGLRFGFMAPGGSINLIRKRPTEEVTTSVQFDVDTWGKLYSQLDFGGRFAEDKLGVRIVTAGEDFDSFYDNAEGKRLLLSGFFDFRLNDNVTLWTNITKHERDQSGYSGAQVIPDANSTIFGDPEDNFYPEWTHNYQEQQSLTLGADIQIDEDWSLNWASNFDETRRWGDLAWFTGLNSAGDFIIVDWIIDQHWESTSHVGYLEGFFETGFLSHNLVAGADYNKVESFGRPTVYNAVAFGNFYTNPHPASSPTPGPLGNETKNYQEEEYGIFLTDTITFSEKWSALLGVRYAKFDTVSLASSGAITDTYEEETLSPSFALMFEPVQDLHTYLSYTQGIESGGQAPIGTTNAGEDQPPLESWQVELGAKAKLFDERLTAEAAIFHIERSLEYVDSSNTYVQSGSQVHEGIEFAASYRISAPWDIGISTAFIDAELENTGDPTVEGNEPNNVPSYQMVLWTEYRIEQIPGLSIRFDALSVSDRYADDTNNYEIGDYIIFNGGATYAFEAADIDWTLRLNIENLTNEEYFEGGWWAASGGELNHGSPLAARFSVTAEF